MSAQTVSRKQLDQLLKLPPFVAKIFRKYNLPQVLDSPNAFVNANTLLRNHVTHEELLLCQRKLKKRVVPILRQLLHARVKLKTDPEWYTIQIQLKRRCDDLRKTMRCNPFTPSLGAAGLLLTVIYQWIFWNQISIKHLYGFELNSFELQLPIFCSNQEKPLVLNLDQWETSPRISFIIEDPVLVYIENLLARRPHGPQRIPYLKGQLPSHVPYFKVKEFFRYYSRYQNTLVRDPRKLGTYYYDHPKEPWVQVETQAKTPGENLIIHQARMDWTNESILQRNEQNVQVNSFLDLEHYFGKQNQYSYGPLSLIFKIKKKNGKPRRWQKERRQAFQDRLTRLLLESSRRILYEYNPKVGKINYRKYDRLIKRIHNKPYKSPEFQLYTPEWKLNLVEQTYHDYELNYGLTSDEVRNLPIEKQTRKRKRSK